MSSQLGAYLDVARRRQSLPNALFDDPLFSFEVKEPVLVVPYGDQHLGAPGTQYDRLEEDIDHLATAKEILGDQLLIFGLGDYIDGYLPSGTPRNPYQVLSPEEQRQAAMHMLDRLKPSLVIEGDHDMWHSQQPLEFNWLYNFCRRVGYPYMQWGGEVEFTCEGKTLRGLVRHRFKGSVNADPLKPHKNLHLEQGPADFTALGHFHSYPGSYEIHAKRRGEGRFIALQSGTYKQLDDYGKKLGFKQADYGYPALLVEPDGTLTGFDDYMSGLQAL